MTEEDEAFNEIERRAKQRKEAVRAAVHTLTDYQRGYEAGFIDGMQKQAQSSVDKAVNAMSQRTWVGLTKEDKDLVEDLCEMMIGDAAFSTIDAILKGNNGFA